MFDKDFILLKENNDVQYFQNISDDSLKAIYKNVLVGSSDMNKGVSFFEVDVKEGISPAHYGLSKYGVKEPTKNNGIIKGIKGREILENLVEEQLLKGSKFLVACWKYGDNLLQFNKNLIDGMSYEEAIRNTFTAKVYKEFEFDKFIVYDLRKNCEGYELVESLFFKDRDDLNMLNTDTALYCSK